MVSGEFGYFEIRSSFAGVELPALVIDSTYGDLIWRSGFEKHEIELLRDLKNKNIIALYSDWRDERKNTLNFITKVCTSGNLREYRKKHKQISMKAQANTEPCVIHRDLNCSNVFINGIGDVKIHRIRRFVLD